MIEQFEIGCKRWGCARPTFYIQFHKSFEIAIAEWIEWRIATEQFAIRSIPSGSGTLAQRFAHIGAIAEPLQHRAMHINGDNAE